MRTMLVVTGILAIMLLAIGGAAFVATQGTVGVNAPIYGAAVASGLEREVGACPSNDPDCPKKP